MPCSVELEPIYPTTLNFSSVGPTWSCEKGPSTFSYFRGGPRPNIAAHLSLLRGDNVVIRVSPQVGPPQHTLHRVTVTQLGAVSWLRRVATLSFCSVCEQRGETVGEKDSGVF